MFRSRFIRTFGIPLPLLCAYVFLYSAPWLFAAYTVAVLPAMAVLPLSLLILLYGTSLLGLLVYPWIALSIPLSADVTGAILAALLLAFLLLATVSAPEDAARRRALPRLLASCLNALMLISLCALLFRAVPLPFMIPLALSFLAMRWLVRRPKEPAALSRTLRATAAAVALAITSVILSLAIFETGARLAFSPSGAYGTMTNYHPQSIWLPKPNTECFLNVIKDPDTTVQIKYKTSSLGWRDREFGPKGKNEYRILLLGDSFALGFVEGEDTISKRLEAILRKACPGAEISVINGGVGGTGPWQQKVYLNLLGFPLEPDFVIHEIYPQNDIPDSLVPLDLFPRVYNVEQRNLVIQMRLRGSWQMRAHYAFRKHCRVYDALSGRVKGPALLPRLLNKLRVATPVNVPTLPQSLPRNPWMESCIEPWYPELQIGFNKLMQDIKDIKGECDRRGIGYTVFCVPNAVCADDKRFNDALHALDEPSLTYVRNKDVLLVEAAFEANGIPYMNVCGRVCERQRTAELYWPYDGHFNPDGNELIARLLADTLLAPENGILPPCLSQTQQPPQSGNLPPPTI